MASMIDAAAFYKELCRGTASSNYGTYTTCYGTNTTGYAADRWIFDETRAAEDGQIYYRQMPRNRQDSWDWMDSKTYSTVIYKEFFKGKHKREPEADFSDIDLIIGKEMDE